MIEKLKALLYYLFYRLDQLLSLPLLSPAGLGAASAGFRISV